MTVPSTLCLFGDAWPSYVISGQDLCFPAIFHRSNDIFSSDINAGKLWFFLLLFLYLLLLFMYIWSCSCPTVLLPCRLWYLVVSYSSARKQRCWVYPTIADEKIKSLDEEVHELKLHKGEVMNIKTAMMWGWDASQKHFYELQAEIKELEFDFEILGERCKLAKSNRYVKEYELADIPGKVPSLDAAVDEKEKDLKKLLDSTNAKRLLELVMSKDGWLNQW